MSKLEVFTEDGRFVDVVSPSLAPHGIATVQGAKAYTRTYLDLKKAGCNCRGCGLHTEPTGPSGQAFCTLFNRWPADDFLCHFWNELETPM